MCVCVCAMASSGFEGYSISAGPVMRLVHPLTSPFAASPFKGRPRPGPFPPPPVLGILAGTTVSLVVPIPRLVLLKMQASCMYGTHYKDGSITTIT